MKQLILILFTFSFVITSVAQKKVAIDDREDFISDLSKLIRSSTSEDVSYFIEDELEPTLLEGEQFTEDQFQKMATNFNQLIEKNVDVYPHSFNYLVSFYSFIKKGNKSTELDQWQKIVDKMVGFRNPRRLQEFLATSKSFLFQNIIVESRNYKWFSYGDKFRFIDDKTPFIEFDNTTLICRTINRGRDQKTNPFSDSLKISNTIGKVDLAKKDWIGNGGKFTWEKVGLAPSETFANLKNYKISLRSTSFTADSVSLNTPYVKRSIEGKLTDRAMLASRSGRDQLPFPQFISYQADFKINNIVEDVDYKGGFSLQADEFIGVSSKTNKAQLIYNRKGKPFVTIKSDQVRVNDLQLKTPNAQFTMLIGLNDSITHTGLDITFNRKDETLTFVRGNTARSQSPFVDSYHKLNIYIDELKWSKNTSELTLGYNINTSDQKRTARFESFDYYDGELYQRIQGGASVNPLTALYNYAYKYDKFHMSEGDAASALRLTISQAKSKLLELSILGFINYDTEQETVQINAKTSHFVKARSNKKDFDNISFTSNLAPIRIESNARNDKSSLEIMQCQT